MQYARCKCEISLLISSLRFAKVQSAHRHISSHIHEVNWFIAAVVVVTNCRWKFEQIHFVAPTFHQDQTPIICWLRCDVYIPITQLMAYEVFGATSEAETLCETAVNHSASASYTFRLIHTISPNRKMIRLKQSGLVWYWFQYELTSAFFCFG